MRESLQHIENRCWILLSAVNLLLLLTSNIQHLTSNEMAADYGTTSKLILLDSTIGPLQQPKRRLSDNSYLPGFSWSYQNIAASSLFPSPRVNQSTIFS